MSTQDARLLVVDDDDAVRDSIATWLDIAGYQVDQARSGEEALSYCKQHCPDLLLCDLHMPGMSGLQLLDHLRRDFSELPVIIVSGEGDMTDVIRALKLGAWDYITKPIADMAMLEHGIARSLERATLLSDNRNYQQHLEDLNRQLQETLETRSADEEAGRELQQLLLPENGRRFEDLECRYLIKPCAALSGDFLDFFRIDSLHIGFYFADVSGHGIASALVTVMLKNTLSRYLQDCWQQRDDLLLQPQQTLSKLNELLCASGVRKHIAMFYGVLNPSQQRLSYSSAGHFPFSIVASSSGAHYEGHKSPPVGLFPGADFPAGECRFDHDSKILLMSDGIFEAMSPQSLADKEAKLLAAAGEQPLDIDALLTRLGVDPNAKLADDLSIMLIGSTP